MAALVAVAEYNLRGNTLEMKDDRGDVIKDTEAEMRSIMARQ